MIRFLSLLLAALFSCAASVQDCDSLELRLNSELSFFYERVRSDECFGFTGIADVPMIRVDASKQQKAGHERPAWQFMGLIPCAGEADALKFMDWYEQNTQPVEKRSHFMHTYEQLCDAYGENLIVRNGNVLMFVQYIQGSGPCTQEQAEALAVRNRQVRESVTEFVGYYAPKLIGIGIDD